MNKSLIPCALTSMNLVSGFFAIILVTKGYLGYAVIMILVAAFFDAIDGRVAYMLNAATEFGKELDSFADLISFGAAPAFILYNTISQCQYNNIYFEVLIPVIFILCGTYRLARYNILNIKEYFVGLPIPVAGILLAVSCYYIKNTYICWITIISIILSFLMISTIKVPRIKLGLKNR